MNKISTAEQFLKEMYEKLNIRWSDGMLKSWRDEDVEILKAFANLHREAILKEALESIPCLGSSTDIPTYEEVEKAVLNAYPKELIQ